MMYLAQCFMACYLFLYFTILIMPVSAQLAGECAMLCNDLRFEVLTMDMCREAKRTLPRPKVGDFCSTAMEQAFSDACVALCLNERPVSRVAQSCRAAAVEMPRPTVRRWCEHGYNVAFSKTSKDLATHFKPINPAEVELEPVVASETEEVFTDSPPAEEDIEQQVAPAKDIKESVAAAAAASPRTVQNRPLRGAISQAAATVIATIPVTIDDKTTDLLVHEGQNPEEAVVAFCRTNVPDDVSSCIRQLLTTVLDKIAEGESI